MRSSLRSCQHYANGKKSQGTLAAWEQTEPDLAMTTSRVTIRDILVNSTDLESMKEVGLEAKRARLTRTLRWRKRDLHQPSRSSSASGDGRQPSRDKAADFLTDMNMPEDSIVDAKAAQRYHEVQYVKISGIISFADNSAV